MMAFNEGMMRMNNELYHYGVKGMRWGHRKDREQYFSNKREYKKAHKSIKTKYKKDLRSIKGLYKESKKTNRELYKTGKIDKNKYLISKDNLKETRKNLNDRAEYNMAVGHYKVRKLERKNEVYYY